MARPAWRHAPPTALPSASRARGDLLGRLDAEHVAPAERHDGDEGKEDGEGRTAHGVMSEFVCYFGACGRTLRSASSTRGVEDRADARRPAAQEGVGGEAPTAGSLQLGEGEPVLAAGDGERAGIDRHDLARLAPAARDDAAPAGDRLAVDRAARARRRVEGAQAPLDRRRALAPVDRRFALDDLVRVGDAGLGLRPARERRLVERGEGLDDPLGAERGEALLE